MKKSIFIKLAIVALLIAFLTQSCNTLTQTHYREEGRQPNKNTNPRKNTGRTSSSTSGRGQTNATVPSRTIKNATSDKKNSTSENETTRTSDRTIIKK